MLTPLTRRAFGALVVSAVGGGIYLLSTTGSSLKVKLFSAIRVKPSQVLDLTAWKINLPVNNQQVSQPQLANFAGDAFKVVSAVQFTVQCGQQAQPGSSYPRSELREMNANGSVAAWSTTSGSHTMQLTQRVTHLPTVKPQLVCGQIHNVADYLILVEIDDKKLYVRYKDATAGVLDENYQLGTYFDLLIRASGGFVDVYYNGDHKVHQAMREMDCYFKAGCYLQSNTSTGDLPTAYGQVEISSLTVTHS